MFYRETHGLVQPHVTFELVPALHRIIAQLLLLDDDRVPRLPIDEFHDHILTVLQAVDGLDLFRLDTCAGGNVLQ